MGEGFLFLVAQDGASSGGDLPAVELEGGAVVMLGHFGLVALW
jgi:hypothetical protein